MKYADEHTLGTLVSEIKTRFATKTEVAGKANVASPTLTGTPRAPTAASAASTTQIATTQFVQQEIDRRASSFSFTVASGSVIIAEVESLTSIL